MKIPKRFNSNGVLDPGTYEATMSDIQNSILVNGNSSSSWDIPWRTQLLENASVLIKELWSLGIEDIYLDGSFVEDKDHPNDIDGYFDPHLQLSKSSDLETFKKILFQLNENNQHKAWNWDPRYRKRVPGSHKLQLPMWIHYRIDLYPHLGQSTGIKDSQGNELMFPSAFRRSRDGLIEKGIIKILKEESL